MGKYSELKGRVSRGVRREDTTEYRQTVDRVKADLVAAGLKVPDLLKSYRGFRGKKEEAEQVLTTANAHVRAAEELILETQDAQGLTSFRDDQGNTYYQEVVPQVKVTDPALAEAWVDSNGLDYVWQLGPRLASTIKEMMLAGESVPEFFEVSAYTKLKMKKGASSGKAERQDPGDAEEGPF